MAEIGKDMYLASTISDEVASWYGRNGARSTYSAIRDDTDQAADDADEPVALTLSPEAQSMLAVNESELTAVEDDQESDSDTATGDKNRSSGFTRMSAADHNDDGEVIDVTATEVNDKTAATDTTAKAESQSAASTSDASANGLDAADKDLIKRLQERDQVVRAHEAAHMAVAGDMAVGGPQYHYQIGPDGKAYAIGGSVSIDTSVDYSDPEAAAAKARKIQAAANAPGADSVADSSVASRGAMIMRQAAAVAQTYTPYQNVTGNAVNQVA